VVMVVGAAMLILVLYFGRLRRAGRARDVGNRSEVIPVDAVTDAEYERGKQQSEHTSIYVEHWSTDYCSKLQLATPALAGVS
jgi:hypothetical protein